MTDRIDLSTLDSRKAAEAGTQLALKHPVTGLPLEGWALTVIGYDAARYQAMSEEHQRRRFDRLAQSKRLTVEELRADSLELAAVLVSGWPPTFDLDGQPFPYSESNAVKLMHRFPWIREQVERFASDRGNFIKGSASS